MENRSNNALTFQHLHNVLAHGTFADICPWLNIVFTSLGCQGYRVVYRVRDSAVDNLVTTDAEETWATLTELRAFTAYEIQVKM